MSEEQMNEIEYRFQRILKEQQQKLDILLEVQNLGWGGLLPDNKLGPDEYEHCNIAPYAWYAEDALEVMYYHYRNEGDVGERVSRETDRAMDLVRTISKRFDIDMQKEVCETSTMVAWRGRYTVRDGDRPLVIRFSVYTGLPRDCKVTYKKVEREPVYEPVVECV